MEKTKCLIQSEVRIRNVKQNNNNVKHDVGLTTKTFYETERKCKSIFINKERKFIGAINLKKSAGDCNGTIKRSRGDE